MKDIRILIVEDDRVLAETLKMRYQTEFARLGYEPVAVEMAHTAQEAKDLAKANAVKPYDLVSLDVNLGGRPNTGGAPLTGLDVLKDFKRSNSTWMVSLLTGVETDSSLNKTVGIAAADMLRKQLRKEAYATFYPERLMVVEKPSSTEWADDSTKANKLLNNRVEQIALVYCEVAKLRYVFRMIKVPGIQRIPHKKGNKTRGAKRAVMPITTVHWQLRYGCGDLRSLPDKVGFRSIHELLKIAGTDKTMPPEALVALEPQWKTKEEDKSSAPVGENPFAAYFREQGIEFENLTEDKRVPLMTTLKKPLSRYAELRELEDIDDISLDEGDELAKLKKTLGQLIDVAEDRYQKTQSNQDGVDDGANREITDSLLTGSLHTTSGGNYQQREGGRGMDCKEGVNFRKTKERFLAYLSENGFVELADHLEVSIESTGSSWSYNPPREIEWAT